MCANFAKKAIGAVPSGHNKKEEDVHLVLETEKISICSVHMTYGAITPLHLYTDRKKKFKGTKKDLNLP